MKNTKEILKKRLQKVEKHYEALSEYKGLIETLTAEKNIFEVSVFNKLIPQERAILDAYLKRFSSLQDYLGAKIFPTLLEVSGIDSSKMSEVLFMMEKEEIIDSLENWIELRELRNELEHDYPDELKEALEDLEECVNQFSRIESYYISSMNFAEKYIK